MEHLKLLLYITMDFWWYGQVALLPAFLFMREELIISSSIQSLIYLSTLFCSSWKSSIFLSVFMNFLERFHFIPIEWRNFTSYFLMYTHAVYLISGDSFKKNVSLVDCYFYKGKQLYLCTWSILGFLHNLVFILQ